MAESGLSAITCYTVAQMIAYMCMLHMIKQTGQTQSVLTETLIRSSHSFSAHKTFHISGWSIYCNQPCAHNTEPLTVKKFDVSKMPYCSG